MALALGVSLSRPRPSSFWLQVSVQHQTTQRKITERCTKESTTTQTPAWSLFFFYSLFKKQNKTEKGSVTGCVEIVFLGQAVLLPCCGIHHFSAALAPLINAQVGKGRKT